MAKRELSQNRKCAAPTKLRVRRRGRSKPAGWPTDISRHRSATPCCQGYLSTPALDVVKLASRGSPRTLLREGRLGRNRVGVVVGNVCPAENHRVLATGGVVTAPCDASVEAAGGVA